MNTLVVSIARVISPMGVPWSRVRFAIFGHDPETGAAVGDPLEETGCVRSVTYSPMSESFLYR